MDFFLLDLMFCLYSLLFALMMIHAHNGNVACACLLSFHFAFARIMSIRPAESCGNPKLTLKYISTHT